ncbi:hypothetical protein FNV43_RR07145 [Rhamnella rubrinervis]|uniref:Acyl-[acyl-carrier-protein] desaturase n=1 Tax=Rhamnella rubrinervis TaxID=2594499 RepID=A0A8K0MLX7_9ROSA|nr:hypothetical protein FNV43_RR07145 [Rhamnella rubrinervis]
MAVRLASHMNMMMSSTCSTGVVSQSRKRRAFGVDILPPFSITKSTLASPNKLETENLTKSLGSSCPHPRKQSVDEIFKSMESWATDNILPMLKPAKECWQPQDFLPDPCSDGFHDQLRQLQARSKEVPDDCLVVLVGNMITEEALPSYHARLNATDIFHDHTGVDTTPWAVWTRGWSAEENRHGDLLNKYLYLSGRLDMKQVETTIQYLIAAGVDIGTSNNPYLLTIYTSFQERATAISHRNTAKLAMQCGDMKLAQICGIIASDEKRHESAYSKIAEKLFEMDPNGMLVAFAYMMRRKIGMPAHLMYDGKDENLFKHFSEVASRIGVYTAGEYRGVLEHLVGRWNVEKLSGLSSEGREAQDYICGLPNKIAKLEEMRARTSKLKTAPNNVSFSWIFDK